MAGPGLEPIAIVGLGCRLPGCADTPEKLWDIVSEGRQCWTDVPSDRYNWKAFHHPDPDADGVHNARGGFFLQQDLARFDASFFGIPAAEANAMDPQQRILLEVTYEALENAGIPIENIRGSQTGVYVALVSRDYDRQIYKDPSQIPKHHLTGCGDATACGRISYVFDLKGPSMSLDTGCSGSMVGLHLACQALRLGETSMAIVGGTNLLLGPDMTMAMSALHMINDNGRCYPFDSRGAGYGRAEGVAAIVIKRLSDALKDGDEIRAVIRDTGINQDGKTNGILLPSSRSQRELTSSLYQRADIDPASVAYIEAHGTGTQAGDAAEMSSIGEVFVDDIERDFPLFLGSLKANLGHSESTSGLASIIKSVLVLEKGMIPPVAALQIEKDVVKANLVSGKIIIPRKLQPWPHKGVRRISVNSFGFGGTNAHCILESSPASYHQSNGFHSPSVLDSSSRNGLSNGHHIHETTGTNGHSGHQNGNGYVGNGYVGNGYVGNGYVGNGENTDIDDASTEPETNCGSPTPRLFVVSAKSKASLESSIHTLSSRLRSQSTNESTRRNLAYTLASRRSAFTWRASVVAATHEELLPSLVKVRPTKSASKPSVVFLFTGQGAQYHGMGRELLARSLIFAKSLEKSQKILSGLGAAWNLLDELRQDEARSKINTSELSQPTTTAVQIAIVDLLTEAGIKPNAVLGHSSGEVAAAYAAGILDRESAVKISYHKGFVAAWCKEAISTRGGMLAVGLGEIEASQYLKQIQHGVAAVACVNSPSSVTISGDAEAVSELKGLLDRNSIFNRQLKVDIAYHSHHMEAVAERFHQAIFDVPTRYPQASVSFFSSVTGCERLTEVGPSYWVDNLVSKVRFSDALEQLVEMFRISGSSPLAFVEVGPHPALQGPVRQTMTSMKPEYSKWSYIASLDRKKDSSIAGLEMLGSFFEQGVRFRPNSAQFESTPQSKQSKLVTDLEPYTWDHSSTYWHESRLSKEYRFRKHPPHDLLGLRVIGSTPLEPIFRHVLSVDNLPWLQEHIIDGFALYPGSAFLCMAIEGLRQVSQDRGETKPIRKFVFKDVAFSKALVVPDSPGQVETLISLKPSHHLNPRLNLLWEEFRVTSLAADGSWNEHCHGLVRPEYDSARDPGALFAADEVLRKKLQSLSDDCIESLPTAELYTQLRQNGIDYGDLFSIITDLKLGYCRASGTVKIPDISACMPSHTFQPHVIHPAVFDAFMHIVLPLYHRHCSTGPVMLTSIGEVSILADIFKEPGAKLTVVCDLTETGPRHGSVDVTILQEEADGRLVEVGSLSKEGFQGIGEAGSSANSDRATTPSCFGLRWIPTEASSDAFEVAAKNAVRVSTTSDNETAKGLAVELATLFTALGSAAPPASHIGTVEYPTLDIVVGHAADVHLGPGTEETPGLSLPQSQRTLWILTGCEGLSDPRFAELNDIARASHRAGQNILTLGCQVVDPKDEIFLTAVAQLIGQVFSPSDKHKQIDLQYFWLKESLLVPRLMLDEASTDWLAASTGKSVLEEAALFHTDDTALQLQFQTPGLLDSAVFVPGSEVVTKLGPDEVRVKVYAHAVNQEDVAVATGRAGFDAAYLGEFAGVVTAAGEDAQYKQGDRVCGWGAMPYTNMAKVKSHLLQKVDDTMSFAEAASIPVAFQTAYRALIDVARMQIGQTVLVNGAGSAVGRAAILLARQAGLTVFATASDEENAESLVTEGLIAKNRIFLDRSATFKDSILTATQSQGVDIVLNCLSGEVVEECLSCVADLGVLIDLTNSQRSLPVKHAGKNVTYVSLDMVHFAKRRPAQIHQVFASVMALYQEGRLRPSLPLTKFPITKISDAFKLVQSQKYSGKVVLEAEEGACVKQVARKPASASLDPDGVYFVIDAFSNLSHPLCTYLADRGARRIVLVSNNQADSDRDHLQRLRSEHGASIEVLSILSPDSDELFRAISESGQPMKEVRGVICVDSNGQHSSSGLSRAIAIPTPVYPVDFVLTAAVHQNPLQGWHNMTSLAISADVKQLFGAKNESCMTLHIPEAGNSRNNDINEELGNLLDYCIRTSGADNRSAVLFAGLEASHLSFIEENRLQADPMVQSLLKTLVSNPKTDSATATTDLEQRLASSHDPVEAQALIVSTLIEHLATFVAVDIDDIRSDEPVAAVGLDSLLAIEFKNWIVRTFQAPMQTSEILDASTITGLAALVLQRSQLVGDAAMSNGIGPRNGASDQNGIVNGDESHSPQRTLASPVEESLKPPPLPIPDLSTMLERNLSYLRAFASDDEFQNSRRLADEFSAAGSMGRRLYDRLHALREADPENWYANLYYRSQYLSRKGPVAPWTNFFFTHPFSPIQHSQAERAAIVASVVISYKGKLEAGKVEPRYLNEQQLCMDLYNNLFNSSREPCTGLDIMHKYPNNDYFVVFRLGHVYKVGFDHASDNSIERYKDIFAAILSDDISEIDWIGVLTTDNRVSWAKNHQALIEVSEQNAAYVRTIEESAFVVCLDDEAPETPEQRARQFHFGNGSNRWHDKSFELIVTSNGMSGLVGDHTGLDAGTVSDINDAITEACRQYHPKEQNHPLHQGTPLRVLRTTTEQIDAEISRMRSEYQARVDVLEYNFPKPLTFGSALMKAHKIPPNSGFQLVVQLAARYHFDYTPACWETVLQSTFHKGRVEINQIVSPPVKAFVEAAVDDAVPLSTCKQLFIDAARAHSSSVLSCTRAGGSDRFLSMLREIVEPGEEEPGLFHDPVYANNRPRKIMSNCHKSGTLEDGCTLRDPDGIWLHPEIDSDSVKFSMQGHKGHTARFVVALVRAADKVQKMLTV